MTTEHTPGPWTFDTSGEGKPCSIITSVHDEHGPDDDVCEVYGGNTDCEKTREANARLIAAAPEMLSALYGLVGCLDNGSVIIDGFDRRATEEDYRIARAAIAKATGEPVMAA
jgi:hypothetical protein